MYIPELPVPPQEGPESPVPQNEEPRVVPRFEEPVLDFEEPARRGYVQPNSKSKSYVLHCSCVVATYIFCLKMFIEQNETDSKCVGGVQHKIEMKGNVMKLMNGCMNEMNE